MLFKRRRLQSTIASASLSTEDKENKSIPTDLSKPFFLKGGLPLKSDLETVPSKSRNSFNQKRNQSLTSSTKSVSFAMDSEFEKSSSLSSYMPIPGLKSGSSSFSSEGDSIATSGSRKGEPRRLTKEEKKALYFMRPDLETKELKTTKKVSQELYRNQFEESVRMLDLALLKMQEEQFSPNRSKCAKSEETNGFLNWILDSFGSACHVQSSSFEFMSRSNHGQSERSLFEENFPKSKQSFR